MNRIKDHVNRELAVTGVITAAFFVAVFTLMWLKHDAFNTRVYDFARFSQAVWNTGHGWPYFSTINYASILRNHFSPLMALAVPLLWIWDNERIMFLAQALNVTAAGLILYRLAKSKTDAAPYALFFLAAFFLNPAVHDFTLFEVRRIVFGLPFFMLGLYALGNNRRWLLLFGLSFTLLAKESVGFFVFMIGVYLLLFQKDWRWGSFYMVLGAAWVVVISLWVIPSDGSAYPQLYYFEYLGSTYQEIFQNILANPLLLIAPLVQQPEPLLALFRILLPLAFLLPFLEWRWVLIVLPYVGLMFISLDEDMIRLDKWYTTLVMPVLFGAIIMGWGKLRPQWRQPAAWLLLVSSLVGYGLFSPAPLGGRFDPQRYTVTDRHRLALDLLEMIPDDAKVAAQLDYVAHLTHRRDLYHFPWIRIGEENIDYFVVDRLEDPYPFTQQTLNDDIDNKLANPAMIIEAEADGIFVLHQNGRPLPSLSVEATAENVIQLEKVEVAVQDERGVFQTTEAWEKEMAAGSQIRVSLYWRALGDTNRERTVSVRLAEPDGGLLAQHDMLPSNGARPTSWWEEGWYFRDLYYLDLPEDAAGKQATLQVLLYDSFTQDRVPFGEQDAIEIGAVNIR